MLRTATLLVLSGLAVQLGAAGAIAQEREDAPPIDFQRLVLRPEPELERMAARAAELLSRSTDIEAEIGEPPPPDIVEAVPVGHVGMVVRGDRLLLVLGGGGGLTWSTEMERPPRASVTAARAVALALESLRDAALDGPPEGYEPELEERRTMWVHGWRFEGELFPDESIEPIAKPTLYLRLLLGVSPLRGTFLFGPGMGLGLCVTEHCVVLEGDLPLIPEKRHPAPDTTVTYRSVNFSLRFQYRPFTFGDFTPGATLGFMTRIGSATILETDSSRVATNLGVRGTLELAWRFAERFEAVAEAGVDFAISRAQFVRGTGDVLLLEDRWTPWIVASLRLRP